MEMHIVLPENRDLYSGELDQYHQLRSSIFIDEYKWSALKCVDGREHDQFDTPTALYILALEPKLGVVGGLRVHCTVDPTLLSDVFPHAAERGFERGGDIYEWTRFFIVKERREPKPSRVGGALQIAALRYCHAQGARLMNMVTYAWYMPVMLRSGLPLKALGLPFDHEDMQLVTCTGTITPQVIHDMNTFYALGDWPLVSRGIGDVTSAPGRRIAA